MRGASLFLLTLLSAPAVAQELPVFDGAGEYTIIGPMGDNDFVVRRATNTFICERNDTVDERYVVMSNCRPILSSYEADLLSAIETNDFVQLEDEASFVLGLETVPLATFMSAIEEAFASFGCEMDAESDEAELFRVVAGVVADATGYRGPVTELSHDAIRDLGKPAAIELMARGRIVETDNNKVSLTDCD